MTFFLNNLNSKSDKRQLFIYIDCGAEVSKIFYSRAI